MHLERLASNKNTKKRHPGSRPARNLTPFTKLHETAMSGAQLLLSHRLVHSFISPICVCQIERAAVPFSQLGFALGASCCSFRTTQFVTGTRVVICICVRNFVLRDTRLVMCGTVYIRPRESNHLIRFP